MNLKDIGSNLANLFNQGVVALGQSPIGKGLVSVQQMLESPKSISLPSIPSPLAKAPVIGGIAQVGRFIADVPTSFTLNTLSDFSQNVGRTIGGRPLADYNNLKSSPMRLGYNIGSALNPQAGQQYNVQNTPQQILGNTAGTVLGPLSVYSGGRVLGLGGKAFMQAGTKAFIPAVKSAAFQGAKLTGVYSFLNGLAEGKDDTLANQLISAGQQGAIGTVIGAVTGGVLGAGGAALGRVWEATTNAIRRTNPNLPEKEVVQRGAIYLRNKFGQFAGITTKNKAFIPAGKDYPTAKPVLKITHWMDRVDQELGIADIQPQNGKIDFTAKVGGNPEPLPWEITRSRGKGSFTNVPIQDNPLLLGKNYRILRNNPELQAFNNQQIGEAAAKAQYLAAENKAGFNKIFARWVGNLDAAKTTGTQTGMKFRSIPEELGLQVIDGLEHPEAKISPEAQKYLSPLRQEYDKLYLNASNAGIDLNYLKGYITHIWEQSPEEVVQAFQSASQKFRFAKDRVVPTYREGLAMGLTPKYTTPQQIIAEYSRRLEQTKANLQLFEQLKKEGLIVPTSVGINSPGFTPINAPGFPRSITVGADGKKYQGQWFAPTQIANTVNQIFTPHQYDTVGNVLRIGKNISGKVQDVTLSGGLPKTPLNAFTVAQATKEGLAGRITSPTISFIRSFSQGKSLKFFEENAGQIKKMQERNIPLSSEFNTDNLVDKGFIKNNFGDSFGTLWNKTVNDPTFNRFVPMLQVNFFNDIEKQALKKGAMPEEAANIAAKAVKNFYGVTGSDVTMKRSRTLQDAIGTFLFAPRYRQSMLNFWVNNVKALKNPLALENRANIKFITGATIAFAGMNYLNNQFNGRNMWENPKGTEDKLLIPMSKITGNPDDTTVIGIPFLSSIATLPRSFAKTALHAAQGDFAQAGSDLRSNLSMAIKPATDILANENYYGQQIVNENDTPGEKIVKQAAYYGKSLMHPYIQAAISASQGKEPTYQTVSKALELPLRFYTEKSLKAKEYFAQHDESFKSLTSQEKAAFESIPKYEPDNVQAKQYKYATFLQYPAIFNAKADEAVQLANGDLSKVDPLYAVNFDTAKKYILYEIQNPGSQDKKDLLKAYPEILTLIKARQTYFQDNPIAGATASKAPQPSAYAQQQMDLKNWKDPQVRAYLDANLAYQNKQREQLGLTPLAGFTPYAKGTKKVSVRFAKVKKIKITPFKTAKARKPALKIGKNVIKTSKPKKLAKFKVKKPKVTITKGNSLKSLGGRMNFI